MESENQSKNLNLPQCARLKSAASTYSNHTPPNCSKRAMKIHLAVSLFAMTTASTIAQAEEKERFPKPDPEKAFAEYKIWHDGDVLRAPHEDWDDAKLRVKNDAEWKKWRDRDKERAEVDDWMATRADRVEWVAGWFHDFASPKNGARLVWTPEIPTENSLVSSGDANEHVALTPKLFGAWVYSFRTKNGEMIARAAKLYRLTNEQKYGDWAAGQLDFYADNWEKWPLQPDKGLSRLTAQSLDDAVTCVNLLGAARTLEPMVAPERKAKWIEKLFLPEADLLGKSFQTIHNIATWQRSATAQIALYAKDEALWKAAIDGKFGIRAQLAQGITGDYLWYEQSFGYNNYLLMALHNLFISALEEGRGDELKAEMHIGQNLMLAPLAVRFPGGQLPTPADSWREKANSALLAREYRIFPTTIGLQEAAKTRSWDTLIDPPEALQVLAASELAPVVSRSLESSRIALLRGKSWQLWFHYGQLTRSHSQNEALNFEAYWNDFDVTHDAGTVSYGSPLYGEYCQRGLAHNALLVDGEGEDGWHEGELVKFDAENLIVSASQPQYRPNAEASRTLQIDGDALRDVAAIETTDGKEHALGLSLQLQGEIHNDGVWKDAAAVGDFAENRPKSFKYWKPLGALENKREISFVVELKGDAGATQLFRVTMKCDSAFCVVRAEVPDVPPTRRQAVLLETRGEKATFTTTIEAVAK